MFSFCKKEITQQDITNKRSEVSGLQIDTLGFFIDAKRARFDALIKENNDNNIKRTALLFENTLYQIFEKQRTQPISKIIENYYNHSDYVPIGFEKTTEFSYDTNLHYCYQTIYTFLFLTVIATPLAFIYAPFGVSLALVALALFLSTASLCIYMINHSNESLIKEKEQPFFQPLIAKDPLEQLDESSAGCCYPL